MGNDGKRASCRTMPAAFWRHLDRTSHRRALCRQADLVDPDARKTVDRYGNETEIVTKGRHDPCVGIRAVPIGEAMVACVLADHICVTGARWAKTLDVPFEKS